MRPMLAAQIDNFDALKYPLLATPKLDGIRCLVTEDGAFSRTMKPIPNLHVQNQLFNQCPPGLDGELMLLQPSATFNEVQSAIMTRGGTPQFKYWVFDILNCPFAYEDRCKRLSEQQFNLPGFVKVVLPTLIRDFQELQAAEQVALSEGFEGLILRRPDSPYKQGRSTFREQWMLKLKRFIDAEATIVGTIELQRNLNDAQLNELGYTKRSSSIANLVSGGMLGALQVRDVSGTYFCIGSGFTEQERITLWDKRQDILGKVVSYKYFPHGTKDKPRHSIFKGIRKD